MLHAVLIVFYQISNYNVGEAKKLITERKHKQLLLLFRMYAYHWKEKKVCSKIKEENKKISIIRHCMQTRENKNIRKGSFLWIQILDSFHTSQKATCFDVNIVIWCSSNVRKIANKVHMFNHEVTLELVRSLLKFTVLYGWRDLYFEISIRIHSILRMRHTVWIISDEFWWVLPNCSQVKKYLVI